MIPSMDTTSKPQHYMKRGEVADLFGVHPATIDRWALLGKFGDAAFKTPGGQWRYREGPVKAMAGQKGTCE
jgi:predicted site-specific integrase-resolvase